MTRKYLLGSTAAVLGLLAAATLNVPDAQAGKRHHFFFKLGSVGHACFWVPGHTNCYWKHGVKHCYWVPGHQKCW